MTVSSSTNKVSYNGNGVLTTFAYTFKIFDEDDLTVILRASDGTETVQTITTHYTVTGVGDVGGGNVEFVTAPTATQDVVILREQPLTQGLDIVPNDPFPAQNFENALDKLTFMVQQQAEELGRSIKASRTTTLTSSEFTSNAADRANKIFAFDGNGDLDFTQEIGTFQGNWAASTTYAVRDIVKDSSNNNIYIANTAHTSSGSLPLSGNADIAKWDILVDAASAASSAAAAAGSAAAASSSATSASASASAAAASSSSASGSAAQANVSAINAASSASDASTSETNAAASEGAANTSKLAAASSASSAASSASAASASEVASAASEAAAAASEAAAAASETAAATSEGNALTYKNAAETAQTAAETAQTAAEAAQAAAELAADNFDDTYLGSKSSDPTVDNDGGALNAGDLYFNTTSNTLRVYSGSAWQDAAIDSSGFVQTTGDTMTGNLSFGDNDKAIFGAGSDLQIYHSGTSSDIDEVGTGNLRIGAENFVVQNADHTENMISAAPNGQVVLYHDNSIKFNTSSTGIDVTGTVTADAAKIENGTTSTVTISENTGTGTAELRFVATETYPKTKIVTDVSTASLSFETLGNERLNISFDGDISFYEDTGTTAKFFWDASAESLGIGTTSPSAPLTVQTAATTNVDVKTSAVNGTAQMRFSNDARTYSLGIDNNDSFFMYDATGASTRMVIDSSGNLLVGKTSIGLSTTGIDLRSTGLLQAIRNGGTVVELNRQTSDGTIIDLRKDNSTVGSIGAFGGRIYAGSGDVGLTFFHSGSDFIQPFNPSTNAGRDNAIDFGNSSNRFKNLYLSGGLRGDTLTFSSLAGSERMRIDSSGNLLVGKTALNTNTTGLQLESDGYLSACRDGGNVALINRKTSNGALVTFQKDGTTVGSVSSRNGNVLQVYSSGFSGLDFGAAVNPMSSGSLSDNLIDLGNPSNRFDDIYATNGTIQTSDRNEKQDIAELTDAEQRVAVAAKGLLRKFRWKDAVAEKGDEARTHFGIIAQDLQAAFAAEGLDAGDYAMFIHTTWTDEETGEERSRMGVRYSELLAFIIAAI